jgi:hypothetical protein
VREQEALIVIGLVNIDELIVLIHLSTSHIRETDTK